MALKRLGIMIDAETFDTKETAVCWQAAVVPFDLDDPLAQQFTHWHGYFPIDPQLNRGSTISASTLEFWLTQDDDARLKVKQHLEGDMDDLRARVHGMHSTISNLIRQCGEYEVWAKGSDFDFPIIRRMFAMCELETPWKYSTVNCLRTTLKNAGIYESSRKLPKPKDFVYHSALSDCRFQIIQYDAAMKEFGRRRV